MKHLFLVMFVLMLTLFGCRPQENNRANTTPTATTVEEGPRVRIEPSDARLGPIAVDVFILDDSEGVTGARVRLTGDMTHAGMVPVVSTAQEQEPGRYRAEAFEFTMAGDWVITAEITLPDGNRLVRDTRVTVPGG